MGRSLSALAALGPLLGVVGLASLAPAAAAARLCGTIRSAGSPVAGAHVVVIERGLLASSDSTGAFCVEGLESGTFTLRALAIGYQPGERVVSTLDSAAVHFELVPLRGVGGWSASGSGSRDTGGSTGTPAPRISAALAPADTAGRPESRDLPLLVLAADSAWLFAKHKGSHWDSLIVMNDQLLRGAPAGDAGQRASYWRRFGERLADLSLRWCNAERPVRHALSPEACFYLARARAIAEARGAYLRGKDVSRSTRVYLQSLTSSSDRRVSEWARGMLAATSSRRAATPDSNARP